MSRILRALVTLCTSNWLLPFHYTQGHYRALRYLSQWYCSADLNKPIWVLCAGRVPDFRGPRRVRAEVPRIAPTTFALPEIRASSSSDRVVLMGHGAGDHEAAPLAPLADGGSSTAAF
jgi:hypothetical protein